MFESIAYAAPAAQSGAEVNPLISMAPIFLVFVVFYFFLIRPQQKKQGELQKLVEGLKKGDKIYTTGGIIGVIASVQNDYVVIKVGDNEATKMEILKSAVAGLRS